MITLQIQLVCSLDMDVCTKQVCWNQIFKKSLSYIQHVVMPRGNSYSFLIMKELMHSPSCPPQLIASLMTGYKLSKDSQGCQG